MISLLLLLCVGANANLSLSPTQMSAFKQQFLSIIGMQEAPHDRIRRSAAVEIPDYIWQLYRQMQSQNKPSQPSHHRRRHSGHHHGTAIDTHAASTVLSYFPQQPATPPFLLYNVSLAGATEHLSAAELHLTVNCSALGGVSSVQVFDVTNQSASIDRLVDSKSLGKCTGGTVSLRFDVKPAVDRVAQSRLFNSRQNGVHIAHDATIPISLRLHPPLFVGKPILVTFAAPTARDADLRSRRSQQKRRRPQQGQQRRQLCKRKSLYIDFQELSWHSWILAPAGYHAYYCSGTCPWPLVDGRNATNHAIVQSLIHSVSHRVPEPCCVPTELTQITMLYLDYNDRIVIKNYDEMVVQGCGCR